MSASAHNHTDIVEELLAAGAAVDCQSWEGWTALVGPVGQKGGKGGGGGRSNSKGVLFAWGGKGCEGEIIRRVKARGRGGGRARIVL